MSSLKSVPFAPIVKTWSRTLKAHDDINDTNFSQAVSGQVEARLTVTSDVYADPADPKRMRRKRLLYLNLNSSYMGVSDGPAFDQNDIRGPYIDRVVYQAWLQKRNAGPDPANQLPGWVRMQESPETEDASGSVSSSMSVTVNGNLGFFGPTPTGGVNTGFSFGESYVHTVKDFTFYNRSQGGMLHHILAMTGSGDGQTYGKPEDLVNENQSPFVGARLRPLPALATSNVPLVGQVVWMNQNDDALAFDDIEVAVTVRPSYSFVSAAAYGFLVRSHRVHWDGTVQYYTFPVKTSAADS